MSQRLQVAPGVDLWPLRLDPTEQAALLGDVLARIEKAPFFDPTMPRTGKRFSVRMTNFGPLGWVSDAAKGYRYEPVHPVTGTPWPTIPEALLRLWDETTCYQAPPEACLVNFYGAGARMGLHRDRDETATDAPVLSVSLGDSGYFRFGAANLNGDSKRLKLNSGDVLMFGGPARLMYHGIDRIFPSSSSLVSRRWPNQLDAETGQPGNRAGRNASKKMPSSGGPARPCRAYNKGGQSGG